MTDKEFIEPSKLSYTIYTKSGCPNCTKVKKLLDTIPNTYIVDCDDYLIEDKPAFLEFIKNKAYREWKTFPIVFYRGDFIGGLTETQAYKEKQDAFDNSEL